MKTLRHFLKSIPDFFLNRKLKGIDEKLEKAFIDRLNERRNLKKEIEAHVALKLKGNKRSEYIPPKLKREILFTVYQHFGHRMRKVDLHLKPNLEYNV